MGAKMTRERAEEFGAAWNSGDADLVASFFTDDGVYHASVGPDALGKSFIGKDNVRRGTSFLRSVSRRKIRKSESGRSWRHWDL
jgi:hypothetical protein